MTPTFRVGVCVPHLKHSRARTTVVVCENGQAYWSRKECANRVLEPGAWKGVVRTPWNVTLDSFFLP